MSTYEEFMVILTFANLLAIDNNIIDLTKVREMVDTMNRKKIEQQYNEAKEQRKVWKGEGKDQRWKLKKADGSIVAKTAEEAVNGKLFSIVFGK